MTTRDMDKLVAGVLATLTVKAITPEQSEALRTLFEEALEAEFEAGKGYGRDVEYAFHTGDEL